MKQRSRASHGTDAGSRATRGAAAEDIDEITAIDSRKIKA